MGEIPLLYLKPDKYIWEKLKREAIAHNTAYRCVNWF